MKLFIYGFIVIALLGCVHKSEKNIHLIPYNFKGPVVIFFNQVNGEIEKYDNDFRVYDIPENGIFKTQFSPNDGILNDPNNNELYFFIDSLGNRNEIPVRWGNMSKVDTSKIQVYNIQRGNYGLNEIDYTIFYIGKYSEINKFDFKNSNDKNKWWEKIIEVNNVE